VQDRTGAIGGADDGYAGRVESINTLRTDGRMRVQLLGVQFLARRPQLHRNPAGHHQERRAAEPDLCEWLRVIEDQGRKTNKLNLKASADYMDEKPITQMELGTDWSSLRLALICDRRHFVRTGVFCHELEFSGSRISSFTSSLPDATSRSCRS